MRHLAFRVWSLLLSRLGLALTGTLMGIGAILLLNNYLHFLARLDEAWFDACVRYWGQRRPAPGIVIAGIDDEVFARNLFRRDVHAQVLANLRAAGARAIFYDVLFDEPRDPEVDGPFLASLAEFPAGVVVLAAKLSATAGQIDPPALMGPLMPLVETGQVTLGLINVGEEAVKRVGTLGFEVDGQLYPSAALALLALTSGVPATELTWNSHLVVVNPRQLPVSWLDDPLLAVRLYQMPIVYGPPATGPDARTGPEVFPVIPYSRLIDPQDPTLARLKDAIVFVGENTTKDSDLMRTPVGRMKGVEVHAQLFNTLLEGPHWYWPTQGPLYDLALGIGGLLCLLLTRVTMGGSSLFQGALAGFAGLLLGVGGLWMVAGWGLVSPLPLFALTTLAAQSLALVYRYAYAAGFLTRFIPQEVAEQLLATGQVQEGEIEATVIVTDIRGYTTLSESKTPLQILSMLNEYHTETVRIYHRYEGRVLNYQGDAQIVLFGLPGQNLADPAGNAVQAALETARVVEMLRERWGITEKANFDVGAGVCTGPVAVAELGSEQGAEYTVIGETVRKCHKVQSQSSNLNSNVLLDEPTYKRFRDKGRLEVERVENVELEGIKYPVTLYRAFDKRTQASRPSAPATGPTP